MRIYGAFKLAQSSPAALFLSFNLHSGDLAKTNIISNLILILLPFESHGISPNSDKSYSRYS